MTTNDVFQDGQGVGSQEEQEMAESIIIEMIQMAGIDMYYLPRTNLNIDDLFNEQTTSSFDSYAKVEMYPMNYQNFGGQGYLLSKFGQNISDTMDWVVSKRRMFEETGTDIVSTGNGDLLYWPMNKSFWQINFIDSEQPFYQLGNLYTLTLKCTRYIYNYETFNTGVKDIDNANTYTPAWGKNNALNTEGNADLDTVTQANNPFGTPAEPDSNG